jgi:hypothetical protein
MRNALWLDSLTITEEQRRHRLPLQEVRFHRPSGHAPQDDLVHLWGGHG